MQMIFNTADTTTYMHEENYSNLPEDRNAQVYDSLLLAPCITWLTYAHKSAIPQLAVVHLFGSHDPFSARYPKDFTKIFLNDLKYTSLVNEYDTSVLYTDMILGKILDEMEKLKRPAFLIYISDHGSVCDSDNLRTPSSENNSAYEVPFLIWTNRHYRDAIPKTVQRMTARRHTPLQADRVHWGLLEMMGVESVKNIDKHNFLSNDFIELPRFTQEGTKLYIREKQNDK